MPLEFTDLVNTSWWGFYKTFLQQVGAPGIAFLHAVQGYKERKPSWDSAKKILTDYDALLQDLPQDMYRNMWGAIDKKHQRTEEAPSLTLFDGAYNYCLSNVVGGSYKKSVRQGRAAFVKWLQAQGFKVQ